jgi:hypothetical protein
VTIHPATGLEPLPVVGAPAEPPASSKWLRDPAWDGAWLLCALWLAPLAWWLSRGYADPEASPLDTLYFGLTALFWIGHRLCSAWLAYCTEAYRPLLRAEPLRFVALPALIAAACFALLLPTDGALTWTRAERLVGLAILDYAFVTHHFAAQHFGALSLYRTRAGRGACARTRRRDRLFALGVGGALVVLADVLAGAVAYQAVWVDRWLVPTWLASAQHEIRAAGAGLLAAATALMLFAEARAGQISLPRVLYVLGLSAMVAVALHPRGPFLFLVLWTSQHWIVATGLASQTPSGESPPADGALRRGLHALNRRPWAVALLAMMSSVLLLPLFEVEANRGSGVYYGDRIFGAFAAALRDSAWAQALVALGFATGFAHYALDRGVYRLSDPLVRTAARGLLAPRGLSSAA